MGNKEEATVFVSPAGLADLTGLPLSQIRRLIRQGVLHPLPGSRNHYLHREKSLAILSELTGQKLGA